MKTWDFDQAQQLGQLWLETLARLGGTFSCVKPGSPPPEAARQIRGALLGAMAEQTEQFMRSEAFCQGMKESLDAAIHFQKQTQDIMTRMRHATEGVAAQDLTAAMAMLRQMEDRLLDRLDELDSRLQRLERAAGVGSGNGEAKGVAS